MWYTLMPEGAAALTINFFIGGGLFDVSSPASPRVLHSCRGGVLGVAYKVLPSLRSRVPFFSSLLITSIIRFFLQVGKGQIHSSWQGRVFASLTIKSTTRVLHREPWL